MVISRVFAAVGISCVLFTNVGMAEENLRFVVITHGQAADPAWSVVQNGVRQAADEMNVNAAYRAPTTYDMVMMGQLIDAAVASRPDGIVVSIPDADALRDSIGNAVASGIPVISINSGAEVSDDLGALLHVGQTPYQAGVAAGKRVAAEGNVGEALCINQEVGNVALDERCAGFAEGLGEKTTTNVLAVSIDPSEVRNAVIAYVRENPGIDIILTLGPGGANPTLQALKRRGWINKYIFATFDISPAVLRAVANKEMMFAIDQQMFLQGYLPIVLLTQYNRYGVLPTADVISTGPVFVTAENATEIIHLAEDGYR